MSINAIIDPQIDRGDASGQLLVWNDTTKRFDKSKTFIGDFSWTGTSTLDCSDANKTIAIGNGGSFRFTNKDSDTLFRVNPGGGQITFGHTAEDFLFIGSGTVNVESKIQVVTGYIGDDIDDELIEMDGTAGQVTIDGKLKVNSNVGFFGVTPAVQQTGYAVPTNLAECIASLTTLRTALINYGLTTTV